MSDINITTINVEDINPFIRHARIHTLPRGFNTGIRYNRHYQLHYVMEGEALFEIAGREYLARRGELCLWAPGEPHSIATTRKSAVTVSGVQFDLTRNFSDLHYIPIHYNQNSFSHSLILEKVVFRNSPGLPAYVKNPNPQLVESLMQQIVHCFIYGGRYCDVKSSVKLKELLILLIEESDKREVPDNKDQVKKHFLGFILENFNQDLSNKHLADMLGYHPVHLNRLIIEMTGMSLHQYIIHQRISEALQLFKNTNLSVSQVAEHVGYTNPQYFSRIFKMKTGYTPSAYRMKSDSNQL